VYVIFDVVGTLFSLDRVREVFRDCDGDGEIVDLWFARLLQSAMAVTLAGRYVPFAEAAESTLRQLQTAKGLGEDVVGSALGALQHLHAWHDADECLKSLQAGGHLLAALTNSGSDAAEALIQRAALRQQFQAILSADDTRACKPHPAPYRRALEILRVSPEETCLVAAHAWDILGAAACGLSTVWVSRLEKQWPFPGEPPGKTVTCLAEVPGALADLENGGKPGHGFKIGEGD